MGYMGTPGGPPDFANPMAANLGASSERPPTNSHFSN
eukprot:CAMPEP_0185592550 /NCGR_PEP_ID=MMETSP0434-20130131/68316_1 /TAXON_ID=626734 ORGANISM="Favella taraikaensis, Strain Fe Narragansett Bay" /NCGR_SAMPLE_ID=MMETSP0434 /ASSEMBLY_ACC=CAM_ASM_000379 /LENGTH=36 /DNA_ID= /DNA_START= /DNA_END= /DNA_ORIENTATION=